MNKIRVDYEIYSRDFLDPKSTDDDRLYRIREAINNLHPAQKRIIVMYLEYGTYSEVAKELHCSVPTCSKMVKEIIMKLKKILECS